MATTAPPPRPLEQIRRETIAAHRTPHLRKKNMTGTDQIDLLDTIGGAYHHDGPYDATLASRNRDPRYAPVEAVKESNLEAIRATPYERVQDSLKHHVPLQGTSEFPPGTTDTFGRLMEYEEGDDLMRDADAPGGPYRRYEHRTYHPDDLKGKGEPSFTLERDRKARKHAKSRSFGTHDAPGVYEMQQPQSASTTGADVGKNGKPVVTRQRSNSSGVLGSHSRASSSGDANLARSSSTSARKRLSGGIKRGLGSLRRRKDTE